MDINCQQFDLNFPGHWIAGNDRDWACKTNLVLKYIEDQFVEAVAAYTLFQPITLQNVYEYSKVSRYKRCLNRLYAKAFVFALNSIEKLLSKLSNPPQSVNKLCKEYKNQFGHLKYIRDSAVHIEDRGLGVRQNKQPINTSVLVIGSFIERRFIFTGEDGKQYEVEISDATLIRAKGIIQNIINSYSWITPWSNPGQSSPSKESK